MKLTILFRVRLATLLASITAASPSNAAPGDLDLSFGNAGKAATWVFNGEPADDLVVQPDGKILVVGGESLVRYLMNGTLDTSFNGTGIVPNVITARAADRQMVLLEDGRIVTTGGAGFSVARVHSNGTPDLTFNGTGTSSAGISGGGSCMAIQQDGKILVAGVRTIGGGSDIVIVRYTSSER